MENLKQWFEANYLDGDKIQDGQMLSSEITFEAVQEAFKQGVEATLSELVTRDITPQQKLSELQAVQQMQAARLAKDMENQEDLANN